MVFDGAKPEGTNVMNLLRRGGYRSIRQALREVAYNLKGTLALGRVAIGPGMI